MDLRKETSEQLRTPSTYTGLGAAIAAKLILGFWFGVGVISAVGVVESATKMAEQTQLQQVMTKNPEEG